MSFAPVSHTIFAYFSALLWKHSFGVDTGSNMLLLRLLSLSRAVDCPPCWVTFTSSPLSLDWVGVCIFLRFYFTATTPAFSALPFDSN